MQQIPCVTSKCGAVDDVEIIVAAPTVHCERYQSKLQ